MAFRLGEALEGRCDLRQAVLWAHKGTTRVVATLRTTRTTLVKLANEPLTLTGIDEWEQQQQRRLPGMEA